jgi:hypothetical protein
MSNFQIIGNGQPIPSTQLSAVDNITIGGDGSGQDPLHTIGAAAGTFTGTLALGANPAAFVLPGAPLRRALGVAPVPLGPCTAATTQCVGVTPDGGVNGDDTTVQFIGVVKLTTEQWDAVAGTSGGLSGGTLYYVSQASPGFLTDVAPTTGQSSIQVGSALNATDLLLTISPTTIAP